jgi:hypothetical protein
MADMIDTTWLTRQCYRWLVSKTEPIIATTSPMEWWLQVAPREDNAKEVPHERVPTQTKEVPAQTKKRARTARNCALKQIFTINYTKLTRGKYIIKPTRKSSVLQIHEIIKPPSGWHMWMLGYLVSEGAWRSCRTFRPGGWIAIVI